MGMLKMIVKPDAKKVYLKNAVNYIIKNYETLYYGGVNVYPEKAYRQMKKIKEYFGKTSGNQLIHYVVCFNEHVQDIVTAIDFAYRIAEYYKSRYQVLFGIHSELRYNGNGNAKSLFHLHIILNSVSFVDGKMFAEGKDDVAVFARHIADVTADYHWRIRWESEIR